MAISSQGPQECGQGSTTSAYSPERTMGHHERAATRHCTKCGEDRDLERFSVKASWCKECINAYSKEHYQRNRRRILSRKTLYRAANEERIRVAQASWRGRNVGRLTSYLKIWRKNNRGKVNHLEAKRLAKRLRATPKWADLKAIESIYAEAKLVSQRTGVRQSVDHFYPLQGKFICGLHVAENLRIIPYVENCKKRNSMPVEDIV